MRWSSHSWIYCNLLSTPWTLSVGYSIRLSSITPGLLCFFRIEGLSTYILCQDGIHSQIDTTQSIHLSQVPSLGGLIASLQWRMSSLLFGLLPFDLSCWSQTHCSCYMYSTTFLRFFKIYSLSLSFNKTLYALCLYLEDVQE